MIPIIEYLTKHLKPFIWVCCGILAVIIGFSLVVDTSHAHSWVEQHIPAFWSLFAAAAAAIIMVGASWLGRAGLQVRPDFYGCCPEAKTSEEE
ncbi:hypothetical protein [Desulfogranum mediterraneum]|uniref:hypothetical protein n=1 Tax=Desulfogranum mediterraneum TaxID=160661 RepID=UPI0004010555|nr:hypothetical protein [Desulfogranum mediterraneum]